MAYHITLEGFEGPLDLLLHLIRKNKLDIYDIPIALVTGQYIAYLDAMQELDMDIASEFLLTAATLLSIKARMLLPDHGAEEDEEEEDPRAELVARLLEYEKYKKIVAAFSDMEKKNARIYVKPADEELILSLARDMNPLENVSFADLSRMFLEVMERLPEPEEIREIGRREFTVRTAVERLRARLAEHGEIYFHECFEEGIQRYELILYFLAVLELIRTGCAQALQTDNFAPIRLRAVHGR